MAESGLVIAHYGRSAAVEDGRGELVSCHLRRHTADVVCGDRVTFRRLPDGHGVVESRLPRRSVLARADARGRERALAANVDLLLVVLAPRPEPDWPMACAYLAYAAAHGLEAQLLFNKSDLPETAGHEDTLAAYTAAGLPVLRTSCRSGEGLAALRARLAGHTAVLVGASGVGKSSLVKALLPDLAVRVQALSALAGLGTHTTTTTTLYHLPDGGDLIDSPGVRRFAVGGLDPAAVRAAFPDFAEHAAHCRYPDCSHRHEPDCAVRRAAAEGRIVPLRLQHYEVLLARAEAEAAAVSPWRRRPPPR
ncbi:MAG: putative ribosome biogenesis GTPase RsgA [Gammaproteobacteria bacterium]|nr:MAG: putative ribosome biogenesis GTPase RsgA [Gammaproteobacteria bacterium]